MKAAKCGCSPLRPLSTASNLLKSAQAGRLAQLSAAARWIEVQRASRPERPSNVLLQDQIVVVVVVVLVVLAVVVVGGGVVVVR